MFETIALIAKLVGIAPSLLIAICMTETKLTNVPGDNGDSVGICQVQHNTAKMFNKDVQKYELWNPTINSYYAAKYLKYQTKRYKGHKNENFCIRSSFNAGTCISGNQKYVNSVRRYEKLYKKYD